MPATLTVRVDDELERALGEVAEARGTSRSDVVREALRLYVSAQRFEELRRRAMPFAEAAGYLTDEDVYRDVS
jgi:predicted transcriptional regulator